MTATSQMTYEDFFQQWNDSKTDEIQAQTSGSTGQPKLILLPKSLMRLSARRTIDYFGIDADWLLGSCLSPRYIGGKMMAVRAAEAGTDFFCVPPSNHPTLDLALSSGKKTLISVVPSQMLHILALPLTKEQKERLHFLVGGSAIPDHLRKDIADKGIKAWESYGMTETASHIALRAISNDSHPFEPLPGISLSTSDVGTLIIDNWGGERPLITNDLVELTPDGRFQIIGRADNVIVTGGLKVFPEILEQKIRTILTRQYPTLSFSDLMITSRPDPKWGQAIILLIEADRSNLSSNDLISKIHQLIKASPTILPHEKPKEILIINNLPRTPNGKLKRKITKTHLSQR